MSTRMAARTAEARVCGRCGLRVEKLGDEWHHLQTVAGIDAETDHPAQAYDRKPRICTSCAGTLEWDPELVSEIMPDSPLRGGLVGHEKGCEWKARSLAYNLDLRARLDRAAAIARAGNEEPTTEENIVSTKMAVKLADEAERLDSMDVAALRAEAGRLEIEGRSKLTTKAALVKAIRKSEMASVPAATSNGTKPKPSTTPRAAKADRTIGEHEGVKAGRKVAMIRTLDLGHRTDGFAGTLEEGAVGTVVSLQAAGRGVSVTVDFGKGTVATFGVKHVQVHVG